MASHTGQTLTQTLTQRMQQRLSPLQLRLVRMLEMSEPEVEEDVRNELAENPALEVADNADTAHDAITRTDDSIRQTSGMRYADHSSDLNWEPQLGAGGETLIETLSRQLAETGFSEEDMPVARCIIGNIDANGYLTRTLPEMRDDLAFDEGLDVSPEKMREVFEAIRRLDPPGVGAVDLRDCLLLQLNRRTDSPETILAREIVRHYFDLYSLRRWDKLASRTGATEDELRDADLLIRSLDPKPASTIGDNEADPRTRHIAPDFVVELDPDTEAVTLTMPSSIPDLVVEQTFASPDANTLASDDARLFIERKRASASDYIELLRMRRETLRRVMEAILRRQHDFIVTEDETRLRPMVLRDLADDTGLNISIISRATAGKYVALPGGIYPLKFFFSESVSDDEESSGREVAAALRTLVEEEDKRHPLNDDALTALLAEKGYKVARRTVSKYRERLGIPVARLRKSIS
ncbi:MAG: RNA polymerase factor sigma-54 [Duncaniella sp.]|nr:RNA polymerase factor sigma-54 [Duncaniella sp.]